MGHKIADLQSRQYIGHNTWVIFMFEGLYLSRYVLRCIGRQHGAARLKNNLAFVVVFVYVMDGDPRFGFSGGYYGFVNKVAIHAFAPKFGQQRGVNIDDSVREYVN